MSKTLQKCVKYSVKELEAYTKQEGSCVHKINHQMRLSLPPYALRDFKKAVQDRLQKKVGAYDLKLDGIILAVKNIKVLSSIVAMRADDPALHFNINAEFYVFKPVVGAVLEGTVRHVGHKHIGCLIYRVFSVKIQFQNKIDPDAIEMEQVINFRIKNFNFSNLFPYIEGELLDNLISDSQKVNRKISFENESLDDSGIEERLNDLLEVIKPEPLSESELNVTSKITDSSQKKTRKRKNDILSETDSTPTKKVKSKKTNDNLVALKAEPEEVSPFLNGSSELFVKPQKRKTNHNQSVDTLETSSSDLVKVKSEPPSEAEDTPTKKAKSKSNKTKLKKEADE